MFIVRGEITVEEFHIIGASQFEEGPFILPGLLNIHEQFEEGPFRLPGTVDIQLRTGHAQRHDMCSSRLHTIFYGYEIPFRAQKLIVD